MPLRIDAARIRRHPEAMCGRYVIALSPEVFRRTYGYADKPNFPARYNVAPTQPVPMVLQDRGERHFRLMRWGFWPGWLKDPADFPLVFNARVETLAEKPTFRGALRHRRCVFLADGFYEWRREGTGRAAHRTPYLVRMADGGPMPLAGLWETWAGADGSEVDTAAIVTCDANGTLAAIHHRMPGILSHAAIPRWLDTAETDAGRAAALCKPCPDEWLAMVEVGARVNDARNDDAGLIEPLGRAPKPPPWRPPGDADAQGTLF